VYYGITSSNPTSTINFSLYLSQLMSIVLLYIGYEPGVSLYSGCSRKEHAQRIISGTGAGE
jgi:hypothetical protein